MTTWRAGLMERGEYEALARLEDDHWWFIGLRGLIRRALGDEVRADEPLRMLDVGCGTGGVLAAVARSFPSSCVVGADVAAEALEHAARRQPGRVVYGSASQLPFRSEVFDVVICSDVLYSQGVDEALALREIHRALRAGGLLILNVPAFEWLRGGHDVAVRTRHRYRRREVEGLLRRNGFVVKRLMYWNAVLLPAVFLIRRVLGRWRGAQTARSDLRRLPGGLNRLLAGLLRLETRLCALVHPPAGTSIFGVASKVR